MEITDMLFVFILSNVLIDTSTFECSADNKYWKEISIVHYVVRETEKWNTKSMIDEIQNDPRILTVLEMVHLNPHRMNHSNGSNPGIECDNTFNIMFTASILYSWTIETTD